MTRPGRVFAAASLLALAAPGAASAHGDRVPIDRLASAWRPEWPVLAGAALGLALFAQAFVRLRRRGRADLAGYDRALLFVAGVALATLSLVSPLDAVGEEYLLSGHMLQHVLVGDAAPALLLVGLRGPLVFFLLPPFLLRPLARPAWLRRVLAFLLRPAVAFGVWAAVYGLWHVPAAYDYVLTRRPVHDLEHLSFVVAGLLVWAQLVDPARRGELTRAGRLAFAFALFVAGQALAYVLIFSFRSLYPAYAGQDERLLGLSLLLDQQLAGVVMMAEQLLALGTCAFLLLRPSLRSAGAAEALAPPGPR